MSAILSFLGGSAFRALWGEVSHWFTARQELKAEVTRMKLQGELDAAQHARNQDSIRLQAELGIKTVRVQADAALAESDAAAWREAQARAAAPTGITLVDAWNGCIRPAFGTFALYVILLICVHAKWDLVALGAAGILDVVFSIIGFYFADRTLRKAGK
jgi:hypothetical protein